MVNKKLYVNYKKLTLFQPNIQGLWWRQFESGAMLLSPFLKDWLRGTLSTIFSQKYDTSSKVMS